MNLRVKNKIVEMIFKAILFRLYKFEFIKYFYFTFLPIRYLNGLFYFQSRRKYSEGIMIVKIFFS